MLSSSNFKTISTCKTLFKAKDIQVGAGFSSVERWFTVPLDRVILSQHPGKQDAEQMPCSRCSLLFRVGWREGEVEFSVVG